MVQEFAFSREQHHGIDFNRRQLRGVKEVVVVLAGDLYHNIIITSSSSRPFVIRHLRTSYKLLLRQQTTVRTDTGRRCFRYRYSDSKFLVSDVSLLFLFSIYSL